MKKLFGVTTAMTTLFTADGAPDVQAMRELTDFLIEKGVNCLYPLGTTGEMLRMTVEERKLVAKTVVEQAAGRCTVFIHVGAMRQEDAIELAKHAYEIGADGIGVVSPQFFGANDREIEEFYVAVGGERSAGLSGLSLQYSAVRGQRYKNMCGAECCKPLQECNRHQIQRYPDFIRTYEYLEINGGGFSVMQGQDKMFFPALMMGCDGTVSGISGVYPEPFVAVYKAYCDLARRKRANELQHVCTGHCKLLRGGGSNMAYFKEALKCAALKSGHMKAPQLDLTPAEIEELKHDLDAIPEKY